MPDTGCRGLSVSQKRLPCSLGQTEIYDGFLFGPSSGHKRGQFVCIDREAEGKKNRDRRRCPPRCPEDGSKLFCRCTLILAALSISAYGSADDNNGHLLCKAASGMVLLASTLFPSSHRLTPTPQILQRPSTCPVTPSTLARVALVPKSIPRFYEACSRWRLRTFNPTCPHPFPFLHPVRAILRCVRRAGRSGCVRPPWADRLPFWCYSSQLRLHWWHVLLVGVRSVRRVVKLRDGARRAHNPVAHTLSLGTQQRRRYRLPVHGNISQLHCVLDQQPQQCRRVQVCNQRLLMASRVHLMSAKSCLLLTLPLLEIVVLAQHSGRSTTCQRTAPVPRCETYTAGMLDAQSVLAPPAGPTGELGARSRLLSPTPHTPALHTPRALHPTPTPTHTHVNAVIDSSSLSIPFLFMSRFPRSAVDTILCSHSPILSQLCTVGANDVPFRLQPKLQRLHDDGYVS